MALGNLEVVPPVGLEPTTSSFGRSALYPPELRGHTMEIYHTACAANGEFLQTFACFPMGMFFIFFLTRKPKPAQVTGGLGEDGP
jgi:hypothetical protein